MGFWSGVRSYLTHMHRGASLADDQAVIDSEAWAIEVASALEM